MIHTNSDGPEYTPDELAALQIEIERDGGAILPEPCTGEPLVFKASKGGKKTNAETCACGNNTMAVLTYEPAVPAKKLATVKANGGGFVRVCVVCDALGQWPKFRHVVEIEVEEEDDE